MSLVKSNDLFPNLQQQHTWIEFEHKIMWKCITETDTVSCVKNAKTNHRNNNDNGGHTHRQTNKRYKNKKVQHATQKVIWQRLSEDNSKTIQKSKQHSNNNEKSQLFCIAHNCIIGWIFMEQSQHSAALYSG